MNDRLKFRVWDKRRNEYIESPNPMPLLQANGLLAYFNDNPKAMDFYVVEFSTGLKDKNGKLIFEGDIIKITRGGTKKQSFGIPKIQITDVYYDKGAFRYRWEDGSGSVLDFNSVEIVKGSESITQDVEVIGNIHQESHLLGGK